MTPSLQVPRPHSTHIPAQTAFVYGHLLLAVGLLCQQNVCAPHSTMHLLVHLPFRRVSAGMFTNHLRHQELLQSQHACHPNGPAMRVKVER